MSLESSPVAIADDGDLEDVRRLLEKLGVGFADAWRGAGPETLLRISNCRHALEQATGAESESEAETDGEDRRSFHIVILDDDSSSGRQELRSGRFDFIVRRPVHPAALRLLIFHALYSGPERRSRPRVAMSAEVKLGSRLLGRSATLTQLSERGCGLISDQKLKVGDVTTVVIPRKLTTTRSLSLEGRVVASIAADDDPSGGFEISITFRPPSVSGREVLLSVMASQGVGSASLHPRLNKQLRRTSVTSAPRPSAAASVPERRRSPRKNYRRRVMASARGGVHTLIGRDLSTTGMRVAAEELLKEGDEFKLVIYGGASHTPLMVKAVVVRNDGPDGCALQFRDVGTSAAGSLEEIVKSLPQLAGATRGPNVVVSEIIEDA